MTLSLYPVSLKNSRVPRIPDFAPSLPSFRESFVRRWRSASRSPWFPSCPFKQMDQFKRLVRRAANEAIACSQIAPSHVLLSAAISISRHISSGSPNVAHISSILLNHPSLRDIFVLNTDNPASSDLSNLHSFIDHTLDNGSSLRLKALATNHRLPSLLSTLKSSLPGDSPALTAFYPPDRPPISDPMEMTNAAHLPGLKFGRTPRLTGQRLLRTGWPTITAASPPTMPSLPLPLI